MERNVGAQAIAHRVPSLPGAAGASATSSPPVNRPSWRLPAIPIPRLSAAALLLSSCLSGFAADTPPYNHDMSAYKSIADAALAAAKAGDWATANAKAKELEKTWDKHTTDLKKADPALWTTIDSQLDVAMDACKSKDAAKASAELTTFDDDLAKVPAK